ncbi:MAG: hypothetical protein AB7U83_18045 [Vicinamibacterales bacterium]
MWRHLMLVAGMLAAVGLAATAQRFVATTPERTYTLDESEQLVKADVARQGRGGVDQVRVAERTPRRWNSDDLCNAAAAAPGAAGVDGYAFTLRLGQSHYEYRTDQQGNVRACRVVRPLDP